MMKENFINKEFIDDTIFLEYIKEEIIKRNLKNYIENIIFDKDGENEYSVQNKRITINLNDILFKSSNIIENMITKKEQNNGIIKDMNNVNIYNLYVINHELEHVNQTKFLLDSKLNSKYLNFKYSLLVKDLLLVDNIFTFLNKNTYYKYHDIFFSEYDADINSFINTLNFINSLDIDIIEKNIQKFNFLIAKTLLKRYKNIKSLVPQQSPNLELAAVFIMQLQLQRLLTCIQNHIIIGKLINITCNLHTIIPLQRNPNLFHGKLEIKLRLQHTH